METVVYWRMPVAFILINTEIDSMENVLGNLEKIKEIEEAYSLYGTYDIIAKVRAESVDELNDVVSAKIRKTLNVKNTLTLITFGKA